VQTVTRVSKALSKVRYVITSDDTIVVNGVVASVFSTGAMSVETLPFHMLHKFAKGALQVCPPSSAQKNDHPDACVVACIPCQIIWLVAFIPDFFLI